MPRAVTSTPTRGGRRGYFALRVTAVSELVMVKTVPLVAVTSLLGLEKVPVIFLAGSFDSPFVAQFKSGYSKGYGSYSR